MTGQTPKQAGYTPRPDARPARYWRGTMVFQNNETGELELFGRRPGGVSGWHLRYKGASWEFCRSIELGAQPPANA